LIKFTNLLIDAALYNQRPNFIVVLKISL